MVEGRFSIGRSYSSVHARMRLRASLLLRCKGVDVVMALRSSAEGLRQAVQRAAHDAHVVGAQQVGRQSGLRRLVFHVAPEMRAAQAPPQLLLRGGEEMLGDIVGALHDGQHATAGIACHGMTEQAVAVAVQAGQHHRFGPVVAQPRRLVADPREAMISSRSLASARRSRTGRGL